jgi:hypothetical protein
MPREIEFLGMLFPTLVPIALIAAALSWLLDGLLARLGVYAWVWHSALFRISTLLLLFSLLGLAVYR